VYWNVVVGTSRAPLRASESADRIRSATRGSAFGM
jgi:hypothetical protein